MEAQKQKIDYKWFIIIGLVVILTIVTMISLSSANKGKDKYEVKIALLTDSIHNMQGKLEVYKLDQKELQDQLYVRQLEINSLKKNINYLKKRNSEKVDSVAILDNKSTFDYITKYLSKRDSTKRR